MNNKKKAFLAGVFLMLVVFLIVAANPTFLSFDPTQFASSASGNSISITNGARTTNLNMSGIAHVTSGQKLEFDAGAQIADSSALKQIDPNAHLLYLSGGLNTSVDWQNGFLYSGGNISVDWPAWQLYNSLGNVSVDWQNNALSDTSTVLSVDWQNRILNGNWTLKGTLQGNTNVFLASITVTNGETNLALTASKPVFTDANKGYTSSGVVPIANGGAAGGGVQLNNDQGTLTTSLTSSNMSFSTDGFLYWANGAGGWNSTYSFNGGIANAGHPYLMPATGALSLSYWNFYSMGNPALQTAASASVDSEVRFHSCNPWNNAGIAFNFIGTNTSLTNAQTAILSTNTNGVPIYEYDPHAYGFGFNGAQNVTNNGPASAFHILNSLTYPLYFARVTSVGGGVTGNYPFMVWDGNLNLFHIPWDTKNVMGQTTTNLQERFLTSWDPANGRMTNVNLQVINNFNVNNAAWASGAATNNMDLSKGDTAKRAQAEAYQANGYRPGSTGPISFDCDGVARGVNITDNSGTDVGIPAFACELVYSGVPVVWWNASQIGIPASAGIAVSNSITSSNLFISSTNGLIIGASTNTASFTHVATNLISGQVYNNLTGRWLEVKAGVVVTTTGVAGQAAMQLVITGTGSVSPQVSVSTLATSLGATNIWQLSGFVPPSGTFTFTNKSSGAGDSTTTTNGEYMTF